MSARTRIFVCSAEADRARAEETCRSLAGAGLNVEIIGASQCEEREIAGVLGSARFALTFFSNRSPDDATFGAHLDAAVRRAGQLPSDRVFIVPVRLEKCDVPPSVDHLQLLDLFKEGGSEKIVDLIRAELALFTDDRDGRVYRTIEIGGVTWLAENLDYEVADSWRYDDDPAHGKRYGRLYTWQGALAACPPGWHIPDVGEWERLAADVGGSWDFVKSAEAYRALTKEGGFHALLGGLRERTPFDACYEKDQNGHYWGGSAHGDVATFSFAGKVGRLLRSKAEKLDNGYSCRCVRDL